MKEVICISSEDENEPPKRNVRISKSRKRKHNKSLDEDDIKKCKNDTDVDLCNSDGNKIVIPSSDSENDCKASKKSQRSKRTPKLSINNGSDTAEPSPRPGTSKYFDQVENKSQTMSDNSDQEDSEAKVSSDKTKVSIPARKVIKPQLIVKEKVTIPDPLDDVFAKLIDSCERRKSDSQSTKVYRVLRKLYDQMDPRYKLNEEFRLFLNKMLQKVSTGECKKFYSILMEVREEMLKRRLKEFKTKKPKQERSTADVEESEIPEAPEEGKELSSKERANVRKLEAAIEKCRLKIKELEEKEVNFDEEDDSAYIQEDKYKRKYVQLCKLLSNLVGDQVLKKQIYKKQLKRKDITDEMTGISSVDQDILDFANASIREVNRLRHVENFSKMPDYIRLPDYVDVLGCIEKSNQKRNLDLSKKKMELLAQKAFKAVGNYLKMQRIRESRSYLNDFVEEEEEVDPAATNNDLREKLQSNKKQGDKNLDEIFKKYVDQQEGLSASDLERQVDDKSDSEESDTDDEADDGYENDENESKERKEPTDGSDDKKNKKEEQIEIDDSSDEQIPQPEKVAQETINGIESKETCDNVDDEEAKCDITKDCPVSKKSKFDDLLDESDDDDVTISKNEVPSSNVTDKLPEVSEDVSNAPKNDSAQDIPCASKESNEAEQTNRNDAPDSHQDVTVQENAEVSNLNQNADNPCEELNADSAKNDVVQSEDDRCSIQESAEKASTNAVPKSKDTPQDEQDMQDTVIMEEECADKDVDPLLPESDECHVVTDKTSHQDVIVPDENESTNRSSPTKQNTSNDQIKPVEDSPEKQFQENKSDTVPSKEIPLISVSDDAGVSKESKEDSASSTNPSSVIKDNPPEIPEIQIEEETEILESIEITEQVKAVTEKVPDDKLEDSVNKSEKPVAKSQFIKLAAFAKSPKHWGESSPEKMKQSPKTPISRAPQYSTKPDVVDLTDEKDQPLPSTSTKMPNPFTNARLPVQNLVVVKNVVNNYNYSNRSDHLRNPVNNPSRNVQINRPASGVTITKVSHSQSNNHGRVPNSSKTIIRRDNVKVIPLSGKHKDVYK